MTKLEQQDDFTHIYKYCIHELLPRLFEEIKWKTPIGTTNKYMWIGQLNTGHVNTKVMLIPIRIANGQNLRQNKKQKDQKNYKTLLIEKWPTSFVKSMT